MRRWIGVLCLLCVSVAAGCKKKSDGEEAARSATKQPPKRPVVKKVKLPIPDPFGLGAAPTTARPGDFVVCPPREWIDKVLETGKPELQTFILYGARMVEPGPAESRVKSLTGKEMMIPNYLVVPIHRGQSAVPGDILLTVWQSGSGMQRAIVVEGGTPTEPMVRYLDIALDNPSGAGERADRCKPDTFHKLTDAWQVGTSVAAKDRFSHRRWKIIHVKGDRVLGLGFAGKMKVLDREDCTPVPVKPEVSAGGSVWVPHIGSYSEGKVKKVDNAIGRVFVEIEIAGKKKEVAAPLVDVLITRPGE